MPWHHHDKYIVPHAAGNGFFGFYRADPFCQEHEEAIPLFHSIQIIDNPEMTHIHLNQYKIFIPGFKRLQQPPGMNKEAMPGKHAGKGVIVRQCEMLFRTFIRNCLPFFLRRQSIIQPFQHQGIHRPSGTGNDQGH